MKKLQAFQTTPPAKPPNQTLPRLNAMQLLLKDVFQNRRGTICAAVYTNLESGAYSKPGVWGAFAAAGRMFLASGGGRTARSPLRRLHRSRLHSQSRRGRASRPPPRGLPPEIRDGDASS